MCSFPLPVFNKVGIVLENRKSYIRWKKAGILRENTAKDDTFWNTTRDVVCSWSVTLDSKAETQQPPHQRQSPKRRRYSLDTVRSTELRHPKEESFASSVGSGIQYLQDEWDAAAGHGHHRHWKRNVWANQQCLRAPRRPPHDQHRGQRHFCAGWGKRV